MASLRERAAEFAAVARLLGRDTSALAALDGVDADAETLSRRWVRWFELGRIPPYEGSNVAVGAGGVTPLLADVAGFHRAFGVAVVHDRPDHVVAELELVALALAVEADALEAGDTRDAAVAADALRAFLRDHLGGWIDPWAARVRSVPELDPWAPAATAAADLVRREAALRNVIPVRRAAPPLVDEEPDLACAPG